MKRLTIHYNAPFTLSFSLVCIVVFLLIALTQGSAAERFFSIQPDLPLLHPVTWFRLLAHALGHASIEHLAYNLTLILLLGPMLEEKYGTRRLLIMSATTALVSGLVVLFLLPKGLLGASGIGFMLIVLSSFSNFRRGTVPLTFLLVVALFIGNEVINSFEQDNISQVAHILGGSCGAAFGFALNRRS
jgi:membrane associated rhomboid family serine protease